MADLGDLQISVVLDTSAVDAGVKKLSSKYTNPNQKIGLPVNINSLQLDRQVQQLRSTLQSNNNLTFNTKINLNDQDLQVIKRRLEQQLNLPVAVKVTQQHQQISTISRAATTQSPSATTTQSPSATNQQVQIGNLSNIKSYFDDLGKVFHDALSLNLKDFQSGLDKLIPKKGLLGDVVNILISPIKNVFGGFQQAIGFNYAQSFIDGFSKSVGGGLDSLLTNFGEKLGTVGSKVGIRSGTVIAKSLGFGELIEDAENIQNKLSKIFNDFNNILDDDLITQRTDKVADSIERVVAALINGRQVSKGAMGDIGKAFQDLSNAPSEVIQRQRKASLQSSILPQVRKRLEDQSFTQSVPAVSAGKTSAVFAIPGFNTDAKEAAQNLKANLEKIAAEQQEIIALPLEATKGTSSITDNKVKGIISYLNKILDSDLTKYNDAVIEVISNIIAVKLKNPEIKDISVVGYSLGGAISREVAEAVEELDLANILGVSFKGLSLGTATARTAKPKNFEALMGDRDLVAFTPFGNIGKESDQATKVSGVKSHELSKGYFGELSTAPSILQGFLETGETVNFSDAKPKKTGTDYIAKYRELAADEILPDLLDVYIGQKDFKDVGKKTLEAIVDDIDAGVKLALDAIPSLDEIDKLPKKSIKEIPKEAAKKTAGLAIRAIAPVADVAFRQAHLSGLESRALELTQQRAQEILSKKTTKNTGKVVDKETESLVIASGGYGGSRGLSGARIATLLDQQNTPNQKAIWIKNEDSDIPQSTYGTPDATAAMAVSMLKPNVRGFSHDAIEIAAQALVAKQQNPNVEIKVLGESGGGFVAEEAIQILQMLGVDKVGGIGVGTPDYIGGLNPDNFRKILSRDDWVSQASVPLAQMGLANISSPDQSLRGIVEHAYPSEYHLNHQIRKYLHNESVEINKELGQSYVTLANQFKTATARGDLNSDELLDIAIEFTGLTSKLKQLISQEEGEAIDYFQQALDTITVAETNLRSNPQYTQAIGDTKDQLSEYLTSNKENLKPVEQFVIEKQIEALDKYKPASNIDLDQILSVADAATSSVSEYTQTQSPDLLKNLQEFAKQIPHIQELLDEHSSNFDDMQKTYLVSLKTRYTYLANTIDKLPQFKKKPQSKTQPSDLNQKALDDLLKLSGSVNNNVQSEQVNAEVDFAKEAQKYLTDNFKLADLQKIAKQLHIPFTFKGVNKSKLADRILEKANADELLKVVPGLEALLNKPAPKTTSQGSNSAISQIKAFPKQLSKSIDNAIKKSVDQIQQISTEVASGIDLLPEGESYNEQTIAKSVTNYRNALESHLNKIDSSASEGIEAQLDALYSASDEINQQLFKSNLTSGFIQENSIDDGEIVSLYAEYLSTIQSQIEEYITNLQSASVASIKKESSDANAAISENIKSNLVLDANNLPTQTEPTTNQLSIEELTKLASKLYQIPNQPSTQFSYQRTQQGADNPLQETKKEKRTKKPTKKENNELLSAGIDLLGSGLSYNRGSVNKSVTDYKNKIDVLLNEVAKASGSIQKELEQLYNTTDEIDDQLFKARLTAEATQKNPDLGGDIAEMYSEYLADLQDQIKDRIKELEQLISVKDISGNSQTKELTALQSEAQKISQQAVDVVIDSTSEAINEIKIQPNPSPSPTPDAIPEIPSKPRNQLEALRAKAGIKPPTEAERDARRKDAEKAIAENRGAEALRKQVEKVIKEGAKGNPNQMLGIAGVAPLLGILGLGGNAQAATLGSIATGGFNLTTLTTLIGSLTSNPLALAGIGGAGIGAAGIAGGIFTARKLRPLIEPIAPILYRNVGDLASEITKSIPAIFQPIKNAINSNGFVKNNINKLQVKTSEVQAGLVSGIAIANNTTKKLRPLIEPIAPILYRNVGDLASEITKSIPAIFQPIKNAISSNSFIKNNANKLQLKTAEFQAGFAKFLLDTSDSLTRVGIRGLTDAQKFKVLELGANATKRASNISGNLLASGVNVKSELAIAGSGHIDPNLQGNRLIKQFKLVEQSLKSIQDALNESDEKVAQGIEGLGDPEKLKLLQEGANLQRKFLKLKQRIEESGVNVDTNSVFQSVPVMSVSERLIKGLELQAQRIQSTIKANNKRLSEIKDTFDASDQAVSKGVPGLTDDQKMSLLLEGAELQRSNIRNQRFLEHKQSKLSALTSQLPTAATDSDAAANTANPINKLILATNKFTQGIGKFVTNTTSRRIQFEELKLKGSLEKLKQLETQLKSSSESLLAPRVELQNQLKQIRTQRKASTDINQILILKNQEVQILEQIIALSQDDLRQGSKLRKQAAKASDLRQQSESNLALPENAKSLNNLQSINKGISRLGITPDLSQVSSTTKTIPTLFAAFNFGRKGVIGLSSAIDQLGGALDKVIPGAGAFISQIAKAAPAFIAFQGLSIAANHLKTFGLEALQTAKRFQVLERTINFISGSPKAGADTIDFLNKTVDRTGGNLSAAFEGYKTIAASSRGTSLEGESTREIFSAVTQAAAVYGLDQEQTKGSLLAVSQMISKGVISAEELRGQLSERIPGALQIMARALGVTEKELGQLLESGSLVASEVLPKFAKQMASETSGGIAGAAATAQGSLNKFNNEITRIQATAGKELLPIQSAGATVLSQILILLRNNIGQTITVLGSLALVVTGTLIVAFFKAGIASHLFSSALKFLGITGAVTVGALTKAFAAMALHTAALIIAIEGLKIAWQMYNIAAGNSDLKDWVNRESEAIDKIAEKWEWVKKKKEEAAEDPDKPEYVGWWDIGDSRNGGDFFHRLLGVPTPDFLKGKLTTWADVNQNNQRDVSAQGNLNRDILTSNASKFIDQFKGDSKTLEEAIKKFKEGTLTGTSGKMGQVAQLDKEIEQLQLEKMALPKSATKEQTGKIQGQLNEKVVQRKEAIQELTDVQNQLNLAVTELENRVKEEKDPQIKSGMEAELSALKSYKNQLDKITTATNATDEIKRFANAMREVSIAINEATSKAEQWLNKQNRIVTEKAIKGFGKDEFGSRTLAMDKLQNQRLAVKQELAAQRKASEQLDKEIKGGRNAALLKGAGIDENTSIERMQKIKDESNGEAKVAIEAAIAAKQAREKIAQNETKLAETNLQIRQQTEQDALHKIQVGAAKAELATKNSENARISVVKKQGKARSLTEEQVAEQMASIERDSAKQRLMTMESELAKLNADKKSGLIGAEQYAERERDLQGRISDQKKQITESEVNAFETTNRRKLADTEHSLKRQEAQIEASQARQINAIKQRQAQGKLSELEAQSAITKIQGNAIDQQIAQEQRRKAENAKLAKQKAISPRELTERNIASNQKIDQLRGQKEDNKIQGNQQSIQLLDEQNQLAEKRIELSQQTRISIIKQQQKQGVLSERQAQEQITKIQASGANKQLAELKKQLSDLNKLRAGGGISGKQFQVKELDIKTRIAQVNQQRIDAEIAANNQSLQGLDFFNQIAEQKIELSQSKRINSIKESQAKGIVSESQAQQAITNIQAKAINDQIALTQKRIRQNKDAVSKGLRSKEDGEKIGLELNQRLAQLVGSKQENKITGNNQDLQRLEFFNQLAEQKIDQSQQRRINAIKHAQSQGVMSEAQAQQAITNIQATAIDKQIALTQKRIQQNKDAVKKGDRSKEEGTKVDLELNQKLAQLTGSKTENKITGNNQGLQRLEFFNQLVEQQIDQSQQRRINTIKKAQAKGVISETQAQKAITNIQADAIDDQIALVNKRIQQNKSAVAKGERSKEDGLKTELELNQKLGQLVNSRLENEITQLGRIREELQLNQGIRSAQINLASNKDKAKLANREADATELLGSISPLRQLQFDREGILIEQRAILAQQKEFQQKLADLPKYEKDPKKRQLERLNILNEMAQSETNYANTRKQLAQNAYQMREKQVELGINFSDLARTKGISSQERDRLRQLQGGDRFQWDEDSIADQRIKDLANKKLELEGKASESRKKLAMLPTGDERRVEIQKQILDLQKQIDETDSESIKARASRDGIVINNRIKRREQELQLAISQQRIDLKQKEISSLEKSGGRMGAIAKGRFDLSGLQIDQNELNGKLAIIEDKIKSLPGLKLAPKEEFERMKGYIAERGDIKKQLLENRGKISESRATLRENEDAYKLSQLELRDSERGLELLQEELTLLRTGMPYNKGRVELQTQLKQLQNEGLTLTQKVLQAQKQLSDLPAGADDEEKLKKLKQLQDARKAQATNEKQQLDTNNKLAISDIDDQINAEKRRHDERMANLDAEKSAIDNATKSLDIQGKLQQSRQNLAKALGDLAVGGMQISLDNITKRLDARKRLDNEENLSPGVRGALQNIAGQGSEDNLLREKHRIENEIADKKLEIMHQEHEFAKANLEIDLQRAELAARRAMYDARGEQFNAQMKLVETEATLKKAEKAGDSEAINNAQTQLNIINRQVKLADDKMALANEEYSITDELAGNQRKALNASQRLAMNQENAAKSARSQSQELEKQEAIANRQKQGSGSGGSSSSGGSSGNGFDGILQGDDIAKYRAAVTEYQGDLRNGGGLTTIASKLASGMQDKFYALVAQNSGQGELLKLTDSLRNAGVSQMQIQNTISNAKFGGGDIVGELRKLNENIEGLANRPSIGNLSISSPNPVNDSSRVINDLNRNSLRS